MVVAAEVRAWRPAVGGVAEAFHARFTDHAYPMHVHDTWTLLLIDEGAVRYDLDRHEHGALQSMVTLLPPQVPHDGQSATPHGFRKRVLYLDGTLLDDALIGRAVDGPEIADPQLRQAVHGVHESLRPGDELEAESRVALVADRLRRHLLGREPVAAPVRDRRLARGLRDLLDRRIASGVTLREAAGELHAHPVHLLRAFSTEFGIAPHRYLVTRRVDRARRLLLDGMPASMVAAATGFYDQPHLTRHFKRVVGTTPARFAGSNGAPSDFSSDGRRFEPSLEPPALVREPRRLRAVPRPEFADRR
ncbi:AraC family ligand binding domain-containing protein [Glycomyces mayteni]|uniref:AraC family ligand binding domain-containing protein n=1 Tax=Glycomyces mayteni TaxID=543887 RepID=A0ABW2D4I5_9ACTN|nr:AraC family transcriptional regulator [Glycomyces mayteni]